MSGKVDLDFVALIGLHGSFIFVPLIRVFSYLLEVGRIIITGVSSMLLSY